MGIINALARQCDSPADHLAFSSVQNHPGGASRLRFAASLTLVSGSRVTAGFREPACSHGCRRKLGDHFQSHGDPGAQNQNKEEALRATEGEGVSSQRPDPERLYVGRQSLGESLEANAAADTDVSLDRSGANAISLKLAITLPTGLREHLASSESLLLPVYDRKRLAGKFCNFKLFRNRLDRDFQSRTQSKKTGIDLFFT